MTFFKRLITLNEMANLRSDETGLPFIVFVNAKHGSKHDARVKVGFNNKASSITCSFSVRPNIELVSGKCKLKDRELNLLRAWIELNKQVIIDLWDENIDQDTFLSKIQKV